MMRFDSSRAWNEASQAVSANREVLLALAGVFLVLPTFALGVFAPQPEAPAGASPEQLLSLLGEFYSAHWLKFVGAGLLSVVGTMAMLALFTDARRPTVGEAIKLGAIGAISVIAAQILMGMAIGALIVIPTAVAGAIGVPILPIVVLIAACAVSVWLAIRLSMLSPAVMVEGIRNPVAALQRSWQLTRGNAGRLLVFFALLVIVFVVVMLLVSALLGAVLALALPQDAAAIGGALLGSILQAVFNVYMIGVVAASHRQLAGPTASAAASPFE